MVKLAILATAMCFVVARIPSRWIPAELRRASQILGWLLMAYVAVMLSLGVVAWLSTYRGG